MKEFVEPKSHGLIRSYVPFASDNNSFRPFLHHPSYIVPLQLSQINESARAIQVKLDISFRYYAKIYPRQLSHCLAKPTPSQFADSHRGVLRQEAFARSDISFLHC